MLTFHLTLHITLHTGKYRQDVVSPVGCYPAGVTWLRKHHSDKGNAFMFICQSKMLICLTKSLIIPANVRITVTVSKT